MIYFDKAYPHEQKSNELNDIIAVDLSKKRTKINYICISSDFENGYSISKNESDFDIFRRFEKDLKKVPKFQSPFIFMAIEDDNIIWKCEVCSGTMEMVKKSKSGFWLLRDLFNGEEFPKNKKVDVLDKNGNQIIHKGLYRPCTEIKIKDFILTENTIFKAHFPFEEKEVNNNLVEELLPIKNIVNFSIEEDEDIKISISLPSDMVVPV